MFVIQEGKARGNRNEKEKKKKSQNVDLNPNKSVIILNMNGLTTSNKRNGKNGLKKITYRLPIRSSLPVEYW